MLRIPCLRCSVPDVAVDLNDGDLICTHCNETYTVAQVEEAVDAWRLVLPWLKQHPALAEPAEASAK